jgi:hypothetical protein
LKINPVLIVNPWGRNLMRKSIPLFAALLIMMVSACRDKVAVQPAPPAQKPTSSQSGGVSLPETATPGAADPALSANSMASLSPLARGDIYFSREQYPEAVLNYETVLKTDPGGETADGVLFNLGLARALSPGQEKDLPGAKTALNRILNEYPDSRYKSQAELILGLLDQVESLNTDVRERDSKIQRLQAELDRLKEIDLKRRPSRP